MVIESNTNNKNIVISNINPMLGNDYNISNNIFLKKNTLNSLKSYNSWIEFKKKIDKIYTKESVSCVACDAIKFILLSEVDKKQIPVSFVMCTDCGLVQLNPRFNQQSYNDWYGHLYMNLWEETSKLDYTFELVTKFKPKYSLLKKYLKPKSKILEIGCNSGEVLNFLNKEGHKVYGVDYHKQAINLATKLTPKGTFYIGGIETLDQHKNTFDCIYMNDLLEHIVNPIIYIKNIKELLSSAGIIFVSIPGFRSWIKYKKGNILTTIQFAHIYYYSKIHLKQIFLKNNLEAIFINDKIDAIFMNTNKRQILVSKFNFKIEFFINYFFLKKNIIINNIKFYLRTLFNQ